jgi:sec-independent protein translocase protein TatA
MLPVPHSCLAILDVGGTEVLMIMLIALLLFGSERLPNLARGMGKAIREFKKATSGLEDELKRAMEEPPPRPRPSEWKTPSPLQQPSKPFVAPAQSPATAQSTAPTELPPPTQPPLTAQPSLLPEAQPAPPPEDRPYPYP